MGSHTNLINLFSKKISGTWKVKDVIWHFIRHSLAEIECRSAYIINNKIEDYWHFKPCKATTPREMDSGRTMHGVCLLKSGKNNRGALTGTLITGPLIGLAVK